MGEIGNRQTIDLIETEEAYTSPISILEMAIKHGLGKMELPSTRIVTYDAAFQNYVARYAYRRALRCLLLIG